MSATKPEPKAPLGNITKFAATSLQNSNLEEKVDQTTGEIISLEKGNRNTYDPTHARIKRFALQSAARNLLPKHRTAWCLRRVNQNEQPAVLRTEKSTHFGGLLVCGRIWTCPCCAAKISERRRVELQQAMTVHRDNGGTVALVTYTVPHSREDDLSDLLKRFDVAQRKMKSWRAYKMIRSNYKIMGTIKALEITHGSDNGWHPHTHELFFFESDVDLQNLRLELFSVWRKAAIKQWFSAPNFSHGLRVDDGSYADKYIGKWGLDQELTKSHIKVGRNGGRTPFDLLKLFFENNDNHAGKLFQNYARAFEGKRQLRWSPGLKKRFKIGETTDEELAMTQDETAELLGKFELNEWRLILHHNARATVLELARYGWEPVQRFVNGLNAKGLFAN